MASKAVKRKATAAGKKKATRKRKAPPGHDSDDGDEETARPAPAKRRRRRSPRALPERVITRTKRAEAADESDSIEDNIGDESSEENSDEDDFSPGSDSDYVINILFWRPTGHQKIVSDGHHVCDNFEPAGYSGRISSWTTGGGQLWPGSHAAADHVSAPGGGDVRALWRCKVESVGTQHPYISHCVTLL
ncbi:hypothetical protein B0H10DRAFT_1963101 [Mycena sp. CBHHK59/15]|nr:hypothetical protein B0H10DRAFT_1970418 [Mycena sp. CBHHK59/15]KAJ6562951.1 hypothetical protein B0H10DRAFT_1966360 [Mycena sp. CBHHK59/15]KAJ6579033.1 hypothetical protein B0H10DRAFT_1963101 [Mycena sp. CBHHK59/15]